MGEETYEKLKLQMKGFSYLFKINSFLRKIGIGSKKIHKLQSDFKQMQKDMSELYLYPKKFMNYFSHSGFIVYASMNFDAIKKAVDFYENNEEKKATETIYALYTAEKIEENLLLIRNSGINQNRIRFIEYALDDYKNEKYYAVIPILLMMIDGIIADEVRYGIHSKNSNLSVWDTFNAEEEGLQVIKEIFLKGRNRTTTETIQFPFRNGILHGRDLGYDSKEVAILTWNYLFAITDFVRNKHSKEKRQEEYIKSNKKVTFKELLKRRRDINETKEKIKNWQPRIIASEYIITLDEICKQNDNPECAVKNYLTYLMKKNYGLMAKIEYRNDKVTDMNYGIFAKKIREKFVDIELRKFKILQITDIAPAITTIQAELDLIYYGESRKKIVEIRCIIQAENKTAIHGDKDGDWKIIPLYI